MKMILSPKDNINKIELDVETFALEGNTLLVIFPDGRTRNYPLTHIWYYERVAPVNKNRSKPPE